MDDLTKLLPVELIARAIPCGNEYLFHYSDAIETVARATDNCIAILGVEVLEVRPDGFLALDYSGYEFTFTGDWGMYVKQNNAEALRFIETHRVEKQHGYILTSASMKEFSKLDRVE